MSKPFEEEAEAIGRVEAVLGWNECAVICLICAKVFEKLDSKKKQNQVQ